MEITEGCGALGARADGAEVLVAEDAGIVAVVEIDLNCVISDLRGGLGANFGFEHGQGRRRNGRDGFGGVVLLVLVALFVAGGAGTFLAEIGEIVMAGVMVGPSDVHTRSAGDVDFYVQGLFALIDWSWHGFGSGFRSGWVWGFRRSKLPGGWDYRADRFLDDREKCRCADRVRG